MSQPLLSISDDPNRAVLGGWNLGDDPEPEGPRGDSPAALPASAAGPARSVASAVGRGLGMIEPPAPYQDFRIGSSTTALDDSLFGPGAAGAQPGARRTASKSIHAPVPAPAAGAGVVAGAVTAAPPRPGDVVGGFRIVIELGRGAFARVYLAEQIELGNRPVALKVSRVEGDEPQMLARLQHTHIVPIHSVYDDPETGFRLLCMPYLGGANLAQVLEAVGGRAGDGPDQRSLVQALDEVSQRLRQSAPGVGGGLISARGSRLASGLAPTGPASACRPLRAAGSEGRGAGSFPASIGRISLTRLNSFWGRVTGRGAAGAGADAPNLDGRDFDQPARQFLREANTIRGGVWIIARLAEGLEHAHNRGLLHRDLKPSNVLIAGDGTPMLLDFNLSTTTGPADPAEGEKALLGGTLPYMSPEHLDAFDPLGTTTADAVDERSDVYSLGLILFEMIAGDHPFGEAPPRMPLIASLRFLAEQRRRPPSLRGAHPAVPWGLDSIVRKCLDPVPDRRYQRARDFAEDLIRFLDDLPLRHAPDPSVRERLAKWKRRNPRLCGNTSIAVFSVLLVVTLGGLVGLLNANMQNLSTRLRLQVFRDEFTQSRFLLNLGSGPAEHLTQGIDRAQRMLDQEGIDRAGDWRPDSWARRLTAREQVSVREQTVELILLEARARVYLAERAGSEAAQRQALEWAVAWLGRAQRLDPNPPATLFADRARYLSALGRADLAGPDRRRAAGAVPASSRDFYLLGIAALARGDLARAEPALRRALDLDERRFWAWFALGHCHFEQGRALDAAGDFAACVVLEPRFAWPHMNRGLALAAAGRLVEARACYDRALAANPRFAEAWLNRALADLELNDLAAAERGLSRAWELGRRESGVLAVWAEVKARLGRRGEADKLFNDLIRDRPDDPVLLTARGVFRIATDPAGADTDLRHALKVSPRLARAHFGRALLLRRTAPREALAQADAALASDRNLLDALQLRALLRARLGDLSAVDDAERLIQVPTPHRLYNASCALALLVETAGEARLAPRALDLLARALDSGFPASQASADPDLKPLHALPGYREMIERPKAER